MPVAVRSFLLLVAVLAATLTGATAASAAGPVITSDPWAQSDPASQLAAPERLVSGARFTCADAQTTRILDRAGLSKRLIAKGAIRREGRLLVPTALAGPEDVRIYEDDEQYVVEVGSADADGKCYITVGPRVRIRVPCIRFRTPRLGCKSAKVAFAAACAYAASRTGVPAVAAACAAAIVAMPPCDSENQMRRSPEDRAFAKRAGV